MTPERIHPVVDLGHHDDFNGLHVGVHRNEVIRQIVVDVAAALPASTSRLVILLTPVFPDYCAVSLVARSCAGVPPI
jgi:hypothetical protein